jgi:hypothetical protein
MMAMSTEAKNQVNWYEDPDLLRLAMGYYDELEEANETAKVFEIRDAFIAKAEEAEVSEEVRLHFLRHLSAQAGGRVEEVMGC